VLLPADDAIGAVRQLRARDGGGLQVWGSASLAGQLVAHDLVDGGASSIMVANQRISALMP